METERIERETIVPGSPDELWEALTDSESLSEWFGADAEIDARPGGRALFRWPDGSERAAVVEDADRPERLAFRWLPFVRTAEGDVIELPATRVEITIDGVERGSRLRVEERVLEDSVRPSAAPLQTICRDFTRYSMYNRGTWFGVEPRSTRSDRILVSA